MKYLDEEIRKNAVYIGDGAYCVNQGHNLMVFTSDGIHINNAVYLEDDVAENLKREINKFLSNDK